jgi:hypothetical protein
METSKTNPLNFGASSHLQNWPDFSFVILGASPTWIWPVISKRTLVFLEGPVKPSKTNKVHFVVTALFLPYFFYLSFTFTFFFFPLHYFLLSFSILLITQFKNYKIWNSNYVKVWICKVTRTDESKPKAPSVTSYKWIKLQVPTSSSQM